MTEPKKLTKRKKKYYIDYDPNIPLWSRNDEEIIVKANPNSQESVAMSIDGVRYIVPTYDEYIQNLKDKNYLGYPYNAEWIDRSTVNLESVKIQGQKARNYIKSYILSPGYLKRLTLGLKGLRTALAKIKTVPILYNENPINNATYSPSRHRVDVYSMLDTKHGDKFGGLLYIIGHELGHAVDVGLRNDTFKKKSKNVNSHDSKLDETYADLMAFRLALYRSGIYDSRKEDLFTELDYDRFMKSGVYNGRLVQLKENFEESVLPNDYYDSPSGNYMRLLELFSKEDVIKLMNTIAQNDNDLKNPDKPLYAKKGNKLELLKILRQ